MSQATQSEETMAGAFMGSPTVKRAVEAITQELSAAQSAITAVRPAQAERKESFDALMDTAARVRGRPLLYPYIGSGLGAGPLVELADGSVKFDMIAGIGVHFFGHSDPELVRCGIEAALGDTVMQGNLQLNEEVIRFARTLVDEAGKRSNLAHAFLCNGGALANESALKVCYQKHAPAERVFAFADCFMGRTTTMANIGDSAAGRVGLPRNVRVDYMPFYDDARAKQMSAGDQSGETRVIDEAVAQLQRSIDRYPGAHACFAFELVQGEGGFNTAPRAFHTALMDVCKANDIAVWIDEVQTFGRTTSMFAFEVYDLGDYVDVVTIGKMSQVCAALYTPDYNPKPGLLSGTFIASGVALSVGNRILERLRDGDFYGDDGRNAKHHALFAERVRGLAAKHPEWFPVSEDFTDIVGGIGGMMRFTPFAGKKAPVLALCRALFDEGVIAFYCGHDPYHVRFLPPLGALQEAHWAPVFDVVERAMAKVAASN